MSAGDDPTGNGGKGSVSHVPDRWWESFYDDAFADTVMATGIDDTATATADFLIEQLRLQPGDTVFDQGCGLGRVSIPLARRGMRVIGADLSDAYIRRARAAAGLEGLDCEFHTADAFQFVPDRPCAGAFNWWSSFGYAREDQVNLEMLRRAWEALEPGGRFGLDYYSAPKLLREFQARVDLRYQTERGVFNVTREGCIDFLAGAIEQEWTYTAPDGASYRKQSRTRIYMPHELASLLRRCGFVGVELYGWIDGSPFTPDSPRCMLFASKPE